MAIQELTKKEIDVVAGGGALIDLSNTVNSLLSLVLNPVVTLLNNVVSIVEVLLGNVLNVLLNGLAGNK